MKFDYLIVLLLGLIFGCLACTAADAPKEPPALAAQAPAIDPGVAQKVLAEDAQKRTKACEEELAALMKRHGCVLEIGMLVTAQGNRPIVQIVPAAQGAPK